MKKKKRSFKISGDLRLRAERDMERGVRSQSLTLPAATQASLGTSSTTAQIHTKKEDRVRYRMRFRLKLRKKLSDNLTFGGRLASGEKRNLTTGVEDTHSVHSTFNGLDEKYQIRIDRAFLVYNNKKSGFTFWAGKFGNPLLASGILGDFVWDRDIQPEGVAAKYVHKIGKSLKVGVVGGSFLYTSYHQYTVGTELIDIPFVGERSVDVSALSPVSLPDSASLTLPTQSAHANIPWYAGQVFAKFKNSSIKLTAAAYTYQFTERLRELDAANHTKLTTSPAYIVGGFLDVGLRKIPIGVSFEGWRNLAIKSSSGYNDPQVYDTTGPSGWKAGIYYGKTKNVWDWKTYLQYQEVGLNSVSTIWAQDDFNMLTNFRGFVAGFKLKVQQYVTLHLYVLTSRQMVEEPADRKNISVLSSTDSFGITSQVRLYNDVVYNSSSLVLNERRFNANTNTRVRFNVDVKF